MKKRVKQFILNRIKMSFPYIYLKLLKHQYRHSEKELKFIPLLCNKDSISIDIGASAGRYSVPMFFYSKKCVLFEPRKEAFDYLRDIFSLAKDNVSIYPCALSNKNGTATFSVVTNDKGRSSLDTKNNFEPQDSIQKVSVPIKTLDGFKFQDPIACIKIDVEGHEESVLKGAQTTIKNNNPALIIEIEDRHNPGSINRIKEFLYKKNYLGYFLQDDKLITLDNFDIKRNQNIDNVGSSLYINNFIFLTEKQKNVPINKVDSL